MDDVQQLALTLARVETKLDAALTGHADHEARIRDVERVVWVAAGVASAVGVSGGGLLSLALR